ncbi:MAG: oxidoreductase [Ruminococcaceae bacterium]|nr:oxidoreductase [Oscillospiraceae bacterium]
MNNLIPITYQNDRPAVSARELHEFLEVGTRFNDWFVRMKEYGFSEETDFYSFLSKTTEQGGRPATDYALSLDMAKELCMIQRTERGKQARQYFLAIEKDWNSPQQVMARALKMADVTIASLQDSNRQLATEAVQNRPKAIFADAVAASESPMLIGELAKVLKQNGVNMGERRLFEWMRKSGYLISREGTDHNAPTQRSMDMELFAVKETAITHSDGHVTVNRTTKVTGKGQQYFINKFLGDSQKPDSLAAVG